MHLRSRMRASPPPFDPSSSKKKVITSFPTLTFFSRPCLHPLRRPHLRAPAPVLLDDRRPIRSLSQQNSNRLQIPLVALGEQVLGIGWKEDVVVELQKSFDTLRRRKRLRTGSRVEIREGKQERQSHSPDQLACKVRGKHSFLVVFFLGLRSWVHISKVVFLFFVSEDSQVEYRWDCGRSKSYLRA